MRDQKGTVIIAVLWLSLLILWMGLAIGMDVRGAGEDEVISFRRSQALYLAMGGAQEVMVQLAGGHMDPDDPDGHFAADGRWRLIHYESGLAAVSVEKEGEKSDLNTADKESLVNILSDAGLGEDQAESLSGAILERQRAAKSGTWAFESLDQLLILPLVSPNLFFSAPRLDPEGIDQGDEVWDADPIKGLASVFTVRGLAGESPGGEVWRILAIGRAVTGPPQVVLCLVVRREPEQASGFRILSREVLS